MSMAVPLPNPNLGRTRVYTVPLPPSVNAIWRVSARGHVYKDRKVEAWDTAAWGELTLQGFERLGPGRWTLAARVFVKDDRSDIDNRFKALIDLLKKMVGADDSQLYSLMAEKMVDRKHPRIDFCVTRYTAV